MEKQLKDYLHLYLGCEVICDNKDCYGDLERYGMKSNNVALLLRKHLNGKWRPILRPLSDMTEEEWQGVEQLFVMPDAWGYYGIKDNFLIDEPQHRFSWKVINEVLIELRKRSVDVDGLIEAGLAIDKTKITS